jgi:hypothetical protein
VLNKVQGSVDSLLKKQKKSEKNKDTYDPFLTQSAREDKGKLFSNDYAESMMMPSAGDITKLLNSAVNKSSK